MRNLLVFFLFLAAMAVPVHAAPAEGVLDGIVAIDAVDPDDPEAPLESSAVFEEEEEGLALLAGDDSLAGGYYFVCDCALGTDVRFYVPLEWAHDVFTLNGSGNLVNLSNTSCNAFCPAYPDYTFSCSRFGTFTYRATNYNTTDLRITNITDTNIEFLEDDTQLPSDSDMLLLIATLIFIFGACGLILRRR